MWRSSARYHNWATDRTWSVVFFHRVLQEIWTVSA